jgi:NAD(P)H dehydrogenase (quinone)
MYALTGANGQLGRLVIQHLLTQVPANQIIATTRDAQKLADLAVLGVDVRRADFSDPSTLPAAFAGAERLLIISTDTVGQRVEQHKAAVAAAVEAGVRQIVYTSAPDADPNASHPILAEHGQTEAALAASGIKWIALRNNIYAEFLKDLISLLLTRDELLIPAGTAKHSWVTREDCARAAAGALAGKLTVQGPVNVTGPEALSFADLVERFSQISGKPITARVLPDQEIVAQIVAKGLPEDTAGFMVNFASWIAHWLPTTPANTVEQASGVPPSPVDTVLRTLVTA